MSTKAVELFKGYPNIRHNTTIFYINCPKCLIESSTPGRKKTFKNLSSLDFNFSTEHKGESWAEFAKLLIRQFAERLQ